LNRWSSNGPGVVLSLAIDRINLGTVYAGTSAGVFKSSNSGGSWSSSLAKRNVVALAVDPTTPTTLYAAGEEEVSKSTDGGTTWNTINNGLVQYGVFASVTALAIDPAIAVNRHTALR